MMNWYFRELAVGEKTRDPIQGEFFATEAIRNPADALVREGIQNSLDEVLEGETVRINILLARDAHSLPPDKAAKWSKVRGVICTPWAMGLENRRNRMNPARFLCSRTSGQPGYKAM